MTMSAAERERLVARGTAALERAREARAVGQHAEAEVQRTIVQVLRRMLRTGQPLDLIWEENLKQTQLLGRRSGRMQQDVLKREAVRLAGEREALRVLRAEAEKSRLPQRSEEGWGAYEVEPVCKPAVGPEEMVVMARHGWRGTVSGGLPGLGRHHH
ncbi:hypothetical protein [Streptomyces vinaceus]|uniref:hypothetical protein n=1 Tax=Streptomyces vinaceus TaxID=1960 RepID=UPI00380EFF00